MSRPVQSRAIATRQALLDAAYASLRDVGYARTSTAEICRRAGTARGTMLHHYPTRHALIVAAMEHVMVRRLEAFRASVPAAPAAGGRSVGELVRALFGAVRGPQFEVWLELMAASRTDPALRTELVALVRRWDALVEETARALVPEVPLDELRPYLTFVFATLNGLALDLLVNDEPHSRAGLEKLIEALEHMAPAG